jgi:hypothetical protein
MKRDVERLFQEPLSQCAGLGQVCGFEGKKRPGFGAFTKSLEAPFLRKELAVEISS